MLELVGGKAHHEDTLRGACGGLVGEVVGGGNGGAAGPGGRPGVPVEDAVKRGLTIKYSSTGCTLVVPRDDEDVAHGAFELRPLTVWHGFAAKGG